MTLELVLITVEIVIEIHERVITDTGGLAGIRDVGRLESAVQQMLLGVGEVEFYPTLPDKAAILGYSLAHDHGFVDGNKRTAFQAMEIFLLFNSARLTCNPADAEYAMVSVASGQLTRPEFTDWVKDHIDVLPPEVTFP